MPRLIQRVSYQQVTSTHVKCFDTILDALRKIGDALPRFSSFETIFAGNTRIWDVLLWLYTDILEFYSEILKFFRKKGLLFEVLAKIYFGRNTLRANCFLSLGAILFYYVVQF